jgi:hypothetical protein
MSNAAVAALFSSVSADWAGSRRSRCRKCYFAVLGLLAKSVAEAARFIDDRGVVAENGVVLVKLVAQIASRFGVVITQKLAGRAVGEVTLRYHRCR